jgi:hypothetical protein
MIGRLITWVLALLVVASLPAAALAGGARDGNEIVMTRDEDLWVLVADEDDDGSDTGSRTGSRDGFTSGVNSNDGTNSRHTPVSWDRDRSRGDLTRDRTRDGAGVKRDWTENRTNDRSRHDSR